MIQLNDYLYSGDTVLRIMQKYSADLRRHARTEHSPIDMAHSNFLMQVTELLEHNDFLTSQSHRILEFYKYMTQEYPYLAFTLRGRIKSLIRAEEKFNGYIVEFVSSYYKTHGELPPEALLKEKLSCIRDLIAYRIVISLPKCHLEAGQDRDAQEQRILYELANALPDFLEARGFSPELSGLEADGCSPLLKPEVRPLFRDYVTNPTATGYRSLHITFYDNLSRCYVELQLRTKEMDDQAEIGMANHQNYEKRQEADRLRRDAVPRGLCPFFDEACERIRALQELDLTGLDVNMFAAVNNYLMNDGCGLYRGRLIVPFEHLSRFQSDLID